ncbi:MAG: ribosome silencing factor [Anaerobiospirillum sp.]|nr:ribosome silencing factor [Anaerobiospirillum sp.]
MYSSHDFTTQELLALATASLDSSKVQDLKTIDVHEHSSLTDVMVIGTGTSNRHVCAMADRLVEYLAKHDIHGVAVSGSEEGKWVIVDLGVVMVHLMQESERQRYQLENLYEAMAAGVAEA